MRRIASVPLFALALSAGAQAASINVTQGKAVTASGPVGVLSAQGASDGWCSAVACPAAGLSTLTDGVYVGNNTPWQKGTIWWDEHQGTGSNDVIFTIELGGVFDIDFVSIEADNNDKYAIDYRDAGGAWHGWVYANIVAPAGMQERAGAIPAYGVTAFRINAFEGDRYYSLSEFRAMGQAVPEPGGLALLGAALLAATWARRRRSTR